MSKQYKNTFEWAAYSKTLMRRGEGQLKFNSHNWKAKFDLTDVTDREIGIAFFITKVYALENLKGPYNIKAYLEGNDKSFNLEYDTSWDEHHHIKFEM